MKIIYLFIFALVANTCFAEDQVLYVSSSLKEEASSEEAILLVQCMTGDGQFRWQLEDGGEKLPSLRFKETKDAQIVITLDTGKDQLVSTKRSGELLSECEASRKALMKLGKGLHDLAPSPWKEAALPQSEEGPGESNKPSLLPWVVGAGVILGGILLWKSKQSNFSRIQTGAQ